MNDKQADQARRGPWLKLLTLAVILGSGAAVYFLAYLPRQRTTKQLDAAAAVRRNTPPLVNAAVVKRAAPSTRLMLPGNVTPITEAYIYARAAGYLKQRYVDIGDRVQAGQKLADIEAPDLDQQVSQSRAALAQAEGQLGQAQATLAQLIATRDLAEITWQRYKVLTADGAVSRQDGDNQSTAAKTSAANVIAQQKTVRAMEEFVHASQATLDRLLTLQGYERITAPFEGVITARNVDVGALISATGSSLGPIRSNTAAPSDVPSGGEMFRLAEIGKLRILIAVPQTNAPGVRVGQTATVTVQQIPNLSFPGKVARTSDSLDAQSRTLLTEVDVDNPKRVLLPGMYAMVSFVTDRIDPPFMVPDAALVVRSSGTVVAVLQPLTPDDQQKAIAEGIDPATLAPRAAEGPAVDPIRLQQVLLNLLSNAFKFTPPEGSIRIELRAAPAGDTAHVEVADSGPGIAPDRRDEVFQRFHQLDGSSTRKMGGTGLGLHIARELVDLHHGSLGVDDAPEGGALFVVELPLEAPAGRAVHVGSVVPVERPAAVLLDGHGVSPRRAAPATPGEETPGDDAPVVLVVEDNPDMNHFVCDALAGPFRVHAALNGKEGFALARSLRPDLIICDFMMPEMSGDELVRAVGAEGADFDEARRAVEAERLRLQTAHLEAQHAGAAAARDGFDLLEQPTAELHSARGWRDEHALDLRPALAGIDQRAATERLAVDPRDQECHLRQPERGHVEHVIALRRIERGHVGIARAQ